MGKFKVIVFFMAVFMAFSFSLPAFADDITTPEEEIEIEEYVDIQSNRVALSISSKTATCTGSVTARTASNKVNLTLYLQKQVNSGWSTVTSWSTSGTGGRSIILSKTKSGLSSGTYRVRLYISVYDANGHFVESMNLYSNSETIK